MIVRETKWTVYWRDGVKYNRKFVHVKRVKITKD